MDDLNSAFALGRDWRLLLDESASGAWNMAVDEALWESVSSGESKPVLRFYSWKPFCLSLGRLQKQVPEAVLQRQNGQREDFDLVRRSTGGRAVWHGEEITYSISVPLSALPADSRSVNGAYTWLSRGFLRGLKDLGLNVELSPQNVKADGPNCFATTAACDFVANGKKLIGAAQARNEVAIMQLGLILRSIEESRWRELAGGGMEGATSLVSLVNSQKGDFSSPQWERERITEALYNGFSRELGIKFENSTIFERELARARQLKADKYDAESWNYHAKLSSFCV